MRDVHRGPVAAIVRQFFDDQEAEIIAEIAKRSTKTFSLADFFDFRKWAREFIGRLTGQITEIIRDGKLAGLLRIGLESDTIPDRPIAWDIIARQVTRSELVNQATERQVIRLLTDMIAENATQNEMQASMHQLFEGYREYRVDRITNTVVVGAFESGTLEAWMENGINKKAWLSTADGRVRSDHDTRQHPELAEPIEISLPFMVGGSPLQHPGDPEGPPGQVINCRCTLTPLIDD